MIKNIEHTFYYSHPPQVIWEYMTTPELLEKWLMKNNIVPIVGHDFTFVNNPVPAMDWDGMIWCRVLEVIPQKKLTYTWKTGPGHGKITLDSVVEFTLHPKDGGTELTVVHSGFKEADQSIMVMINAMREGWPKQMAKMEGALNTADHGNS